MKGRKIKILTGMLALLGISSCNGPDMYGPAPDDYKVMYGPAPASYEAVVPEVPQVENEDVTDGE